MSDRACPLALRDAALYRSTVDYRHILAATDFSELGDHALAQAAQLALQAGARLTAVHILPEPAAPSPLTAHYDVRTDDARRTRAMGEARTMLEKRVPPDLRARGLAVEYEVRTGDPTDELLALDVKLAPELIVLATHGRRGWRRLILGSVAERVVQLARADVLVVRATPDDEGA